MNIVSGGKKEPFWTGARESQEQSMPVIQGIHPYLWFYTLFLSDRTSKTFPQSTAHKKQICPHENAHSVEAKSYSIRRSHNSFLPLSGLAKQLSQMHQWCRRCMKIPLSFFGDWYAQDQADFSVLLYLLFLSNYVEMPSGE